MIPAHSLIWRIGAIDFVSLREAMIRIIQKLMHVSLAQFTDPDHLNESGSVLTSLDETSCHTGRTGGSR